MDDKNVWNHSSHHNTNTEWKERNEFRDNEFRDNEFRDNDFMFVMTIFIPLKQ